MLAVQTKAQHGERRISTVDRLVEALRERLKAGDYAPGHHFVESELTQEFGVSRGPVREALRRLMAEGLLTNEHKRGIRVRRLSREDVVSLYQAREVLEGLGARLAAARIREGDFEARLRALLADMDAAIERSDVDRYYELNEALHMLIIEISGNSYLPGMVEQLRIPAMRLQFRQRNQLERSRQSHEDHKPLVRAILAGDQDLAEHSMRAHIRHSAAYVDALFAPAAGAAADPRAPNARPMAKAEEPKAPASGRRAHGTDATTPRAAARPVIRRE